MSSLGATLAWRIALCAGAAWIGWRLGSWVGIVITSPLCGIALARPLYELAGALHHRVREAAYRPVEGRYWVFRGTPVDVIEDDDHQRWVRLADVRRIVGSTAGDGALASTYPAGFRALGTPPQPYLRDSDLLAHLAKQRSAQALRLKHWVEREIAFPARRVRERAGLSSDDVASAPASTERDD